MSLLDWLADRVRGDEEDELARSQGLTVTRLSFGRRQIGHPDMPAFLEYRRQYAGEDARDLDDSALFTAQNTRDGRASSSGGVLEHPRIHA